MPKLAVVALSSLVLGSIACGPSLPDVGKTELPETTSTGDAFPGVKCSAVRPQTEPDLMGWDSGSRANLNSLRRQGVIAVRYDAKGCNVELEVLSNCIGKGSYAYEPYPSRDRKVARNATELFAELPLGAAKLSGHVKNGRALRTDYVLAGVASLPAGSGFARANLAGPDCSKATHVISKVYLGGFGMFAGEVSTIQAQASLFGVGAGGANEAQAERVALEGNPEACETAQKDGNENRLCAVPLRIGLLALEAVAQPAGVTSSQTPTPAGTTTVRPKEPPPVVSGGADRDGDGIADASDQCPDQPEDVDGFQDRDGCPDADNDADGVADARDKCPNEAETVNGFQDEDGCPDAKVASLLEGLSEDQVRSVVAKNTTSIRRQCWNPRAASAGPATVKMAARLIIAPSGDVESVAISGGDEQAHPGLGACVGGYVKTWKFPAAGKGTTVSIPFVFAKQ